MLQQFAKKFSHTFDIPVLVEGSDTYVFSLQGLHIELLPLPLGMAFRTKLVQCPEKKKEDLFIFLMRANLLGQGTGGFSIGMEEKEDLLTLLANLPYECEYRTFQDTLEDFVNYALYWREEVINFEKSWQPI